MNTLAGAADAGCSFRFCRACAAASPSPWARAAGTTRATRATTRMPKRFMANPFLEDYSLRSDATGSTAAARRAGT